MSSASTPVTVAAETISIGGLTLPRAEVIGAEAKPAESTARNLAFFVLGCLFPIIAIITLTLGRKATHEGADGALLTLIGYITAPGPFLAIALSFVWKKPWGVIVETPTRYRTAVQTATAADAERIAADVRQALAH